MKTGYVYALIDPRTGLVRYIGQTINLKQRLTHHVCRPSGKEMGQWIRELKRCDLLPQMDVLEEAPIDELSKREHYWMVAMVRRSQPLCNAYTAEMIAAYYASD